ITSTPGNIELINQDVFIEEIQPSDTRTASGYITIRVDHTFEMELPEMTWQTIAYVQGDVNHDGKVDIGDITKLAIYWLSNERTCDIAPLGAPDGIANLADLSVIADNWDQN
ncbi:MAG: hypothetical protein KAS23_16900, partial [Anaerohalosphaera sp.]|nr:hypothetical protein [Anaerohalosphaera sp.]